MFLKLYSRTNFGSYVSKRKRLINLRFIFYFLFFVKMLLLQKCRSKQVPNSVVVFKEASSLGWFFYTQHACIQMIIRLFIFLYSYVTRTITITISFTMLFFFSMYKFSTRKNTRMISLCVKFRWQIVSSNWNTLFETVFNFLSIVYL